MSVTSPDKTPDTPRAGRDAVLRAARNGAAFTILGIGLSQGLRLVSNLIMAGLLAPEAFGLMGIALTVNFALRMLTDIGIASSIVRSDHGEDPAFLRTAWVTAIARNALVASLIVAVAYALFLNADRMPPDSIYAKDILPAFVACASIQVLISGFASPTFALAQRRLTIGVLITFETATQVLSMIAMFTAAMLGAGPWSLLIGAVTGATSTVIFSHTVIPGPRMAFEWHRKHFGEIFSFGKWLLLASGFGFVLNRGDQLIFGYLFDANTFSLYVIASLWTVAAIGVAGSLLQRVCYPALARTARDHSEDVTAVYERFRLYADGAAVIGFLGLFFLIGPFFELAYRDSYQDAAPLVRILALSLLLVPYRLINTVILSGGDSRRFTFITGVPAVLMLVLLPTLHAVGGPSASVLGYALIQVATVPFSWMIGRRKIDFSVWTEGRMVVAITAASLLVVIGA